MNPTYYNWSKEQDNKLKIISSVLKKLHAINQKFLWVIKKLFYDREERILRAIYKNENISPTEKSKLLVEKIKEIGLEPYKRPDTYPAIDKNMIHLVCWVGLTK